MSKSQVNALLHVTRGLHKDVLAAYPALKDSFLKDFRRLTLCCQNRGIGFFTLDLPCLLSILLEGIESGRLVLKGPLSRAVSKKVKVPRLYSGLWLRIFDKNAYLRQEVDVDALNFLKMLLSFAKKLENGCSFDRKQTTVGAYHDIERGLRRPTFGWHLDSLHSTHHNLKRARALRGSDGPDGSSSIEGYEPDLFGCTNHGICNYSGFPGGDHDLLHGSPLYAEPQLVDHVYQCVENFDRNPESVHLVQALDYNSDGVGRSLPLFSGQAFPALSLSDQSLLNKIQKVSDLISIQLGIFDPISFSSDMEESSNGIGFKHGPGAVAERLPQWEKSHFLNWSDKLQGSFPFESCGKTAGDTRSRPLNHEVASRLYCVPKTTKSPRLIAAESTSQQWCQQAILGFFFRQCRSAFGHYFIDFKDQSLSSDMVLRASKDKSLATVDLSDASDRLSCWTVERIFRRNQSILIALHAARTRYLRDEISQDKGFLKLKKFASQGTATTFPVMSLTMLCIALGSCLRGNVTMANIWKLRDQVRVFGDDIIIPTHGYEGLVRAMNLLQLKVNMTKSYINGHYRESCGTDGYKGYDITSVTPKCIIPDSPASCQAVVDLTNNLFNKGYWHASTFCETLLPPRIRRGLRIVGINEAGIRGLSSYCGGDESHLKQRWNLRLHRYEVRVWGTVPRTLKRPRDGYSTLLDFFASRHNPEHARVMSNYVSTRKTKSGLLWEPSRYPTQRVTAASQIPQLDGIPRLS
jgi:hypothetical protein